MDALRQEFYVDDGLIRSALLHHSSFNVNYLESMVKADVFLPRDDERLRQEMARRSQILLNPNDSTSTVFIASPEDTVESSLEQFPEGQLMGPAAKMIQI